MMRKIHPTFFPLALLLWGCAVFPALAGIAFDESSKTITLSTSNLQMQINTDEMCVLDRMVLDGVEVVSPPQPVFSGVQIAGQWYTSMKTASPTVVVDGDTVTLRGIRFGPDTALVEETWLFAMIDNQISWRIERTYTQPATLDDTVMPAWDFSSMTTWEGAILDHGGVAWCRFLDQPHTTYGCQAQTVTLWHPADDRCLRIEPRLEPSQHMAVRFTHQPEGAFRYASVLTPEPLKPKHNLSRFLHARSDLWAPFQVEAGKLAVDYILTPLRYSQAYNRGTFVGIDGPLVNAILDTIARYGVIDRNIVGSNGWRTGYKCLHEPWFAQMALAIADPDYTQNLQDSLNYERDHAIQPDGRVKSRFFFNDA
ncbi:MAG: hypothetical protein RBU29_09940, partial [bacterium]|nr:hypothetical protein [bacterium]